MNDIAVTGQATLPANEYPPTKPCLTPPLERLVNMVRERHPRNSFNFESELPHLKDETTALIRTTLMEYARYLSPAPRKHVAGRVTTLLAHYFVPDMPMPLQTAVINDWLDDLSEFPAWAVDEACGAWRQTESRRPTPAAIRKICQSAVRDVEFERSIFSQVLNCQDTGESNRARVGTD